MLKRAVFPSRVVCLFLAALVGPGAVSARGVRVQDGPVVERQASAPTADGPVVVREGVNRSGVLFIRVNKQGSTVYLDGKPIGTSVKDDETFTVRRCAVGSKMRVEAEHAGHARVAKDIKIEAGEPAEVKLSFGWRTALAAPTAPAPFAAAETTPASATSSDAAPRSAPRQAWIQQSSIGEYAFTSDERMVTGDFNGDKLSDVFVRTGSAVHILYGQPDGTLKRGWTHQVKYDEWTFAAGERFAAGDFNGDGLSDLFVRTGKSVHVLYGQPGGDLKRGWSHTNNVEDWTFADDEYFVAGDFNADGRSDVFVRSGPSAYILYGDSTGDLKVKWRHQGSVGEWAFSAGETAVAGDFNGDKISDVFVRSGQSAHILFGQPSGDLKRGWTHTGSLGRWAFNPADVLVAADFNGDGRSDLIVKQRAGVLMFNSLSSGDLEAAWGQPAFDPTWKPAPGDSIVAGDFDGDRKADLFVRTGRYAIVVYA